MPQTTWYVVFAAMVIGIDARGGCVRELGHLPQRLSFNMLFGWHRFQDRGLGAGFVLARARCTVGGRLLRCSGWYAAATAGHYLHLCIQSVARLFASWLQQDDAPGVMICTDVCGTWCWEDDDLSPGDWRVVCTRWRSGDNGTRQVLSLSTPALVLGGGLGGGQPVPLYAI